MKLKTIIIITVLIIAAIATLFLLTDQTITGEVVKYQHSFTKAICNESNYCQDYEIVCEENKTISRTPMSGAIIQHSEDWEDPRDENSKNKACENFYSP